MRMISIEQIKKNLKSDDFFLCCKIPMGYRNGFPVLQVKNGSLCVIFPYLKYQITGEVDKTLIYPIHYAITMELPTEKIIGFEDYEYNADFKNMDFDKPIGYFRHDAIRQYDKKQYAALYQELMEEYDRVIRSLLGNGAYHFKDEKRMSQLLKPLVEPSLLPMYKAIDIDFYNKYLEKG